MPGAALQLKADLWALLILAMSLRLSAEIRRVPEDYPTIQSALDTVAAGDTILIEPGTYVEALSAPPLSFVMKGHVNPDTGQNSRPVIDPTVLPGSQHLGCLTLSNGNATIEDLVFRNRAGMYPHEDPTPGGIQSNAESLTARRCLFDSTFNSIYSENHPVHLEQCIFRKSNHFCVFTASARLIATDCDIHGHTDWGLLQCGDSTDIERCHLSNGPGDNHLIIAAGRGIIIRRCDFGPFGPSDWYPVMIGTGDVQFIENVLSGCIAQVALVSVNTIWNRPSVFTGNVFVDNVVTDPRVSDWHMLTAIDGDPSPDWHGLQADSNIFLASNFRAIRCTGQDEITRCRFSNLTGTGAAVSTWYRQTTLRNNWFDRTGRAVEGDPSAYADARWNWWGDSSGPFQEFNNPQGRGDSVGDYVQFDPWLRDTSFLRADHWSAPTASDFMLTVSPNPFNSTTRISFSFPKVARGVFRVYDITGRHVTTLADQRFDAGEHEVQFDGKDLASGIYFVRMEGGGMSRVQKMVLMK